MFMHFTRYVGTEEAQVKLTIKHTVTVLVLLATYLPVVCAYLVA